MKRDRQSLTASPLQFFGIPLASTPSSARGRVEGMAKKGRLDMSTNQETRLFIAIRELERILEGKEIGLEDLTYGLSNLRTELEGIQRAARMARKESAKELAAA